MIIYRWVERCAAFTPFSPDFENIKDAMAWGGIKVRYGNLSPEHLEVFLITIEGDKTDIYKPIITLGSIGV